MDMVFSHVNQFELNWSDGWIHIDYIYFHVAVSHFSQSKYEFLSSCGLIQLYVCVVAVLVSSCHCRSLRTLRRTSAGTWWSEWNARRLICVWMWRRRATPLAVSCCVKTRRPATHRSCQPRPSMTSTSAGYHRSVLSRLFSTQLILSLLLRLASYSNSISRA